MSIVELNQDNFEEEVIRGISPVLVCFSRPGCPACYNILPILERISKEFKTGIVNIYENPTIAKEYKIPAVPTLIIFKNGIPKERAVGIREEKVLLDKMELLKF